MSFQRMAGGASYLHPLLSGPPPLSFCVKPLPRMKTRKLFLLALLLVVSALLEQMTALRYASRSAELLGREVAAPAEAVQLRAERSIVNRRCTEALFTGISCALLSCVFAVLSRRADESAPRTIVVVLLVFYGVLQFGVV
jgi:hypothetical protein